MTLKKQSAKFRWTLETLLQKDWIAKDYKEKLTEFFDNSLNNRHKNSIRHKQSCN